MFIGALSRRQRFAIFLLTGIAAGTAHGVARGRIVITFPTLLNLEIPARQANLGTSLG